MVGGGYVLAIGPPRAELEGGPCRCDAGEEHGSRIAKGMLVAGLRHVEHGGLAAVIHYRGGAQVRAAVLLESRHICHSHSLHPRR